VNLVDESLQQRLGLGFFKGVAFGAGAFATPATAEGKSRGCTEENERNKQGAEKGKPLLS